MPKTREEIRETEKKRHWKNVEYIRERKSVPCMDCGGTFPHYCMDFHHIDESTKNSSIGRKPFAHQMAKRSRRVIDEEIDKCVIVCANCHRIRHHLDN